MALINMLLLLSLLCLATHKHTVTARTVLEFSSETAKPRGNLKSLHFVSRVMVPYGPNLYDNSTTIQNATTDRPWRGYGFGMGAAEEMAYDTRQHYAYVASALGFITVVDYQNPTSPVLTEFAIADLGEVNDLAVCPDKHWLFVSVASRGVVEVYKTVQRDSNEQQDQNLELLLSFAPPGGVPSVLLPNKNCTLLAISNENQEESAYGTVTLVRDLHLMDDRQMPTITSIPMDSSESATNAWDDDYVLRKGLHMPLTKNALEYWGDHSPIATLTNFSHVRGSKYRSSLFLEGEYLAWANPEETELLVNLQINNGLLRIDVRSNKALALAGYGLKDHGRVPIDIDSSDKACNLKTYPNLFSLRSPDSIRTIRYNDKLYVITANEGDEKEFEEYTDILPASDLFIGDSFGLPNVRVPAMKMEYARLFNADCQDAGCVNSVELSVGSTAIDYELDPAHPTFHQMVLVGGRGWTIYELPQDPDALLKLVFDSGDDMERDACKKFPWAHNAVVDEEFAPTPDMPNHTLWNWDEGIREDLIEKNNPEQKGCMDQGDGTPGACSMEKTTDAESDSAGPQIEHIEAGVACGRLFAVVASEKTSVAWLYDITNLSSPDLVQTFHLSPASQHKSPGLAYNDGTIGEIDPENFLFLSKEESPSGKAAILFGGAYSGTLSYWEFECIEENDDVPMLDDTASSSSRVGACASVMWTVVFALGLVHVLSASMLYG